MAHERQEEKEDENKMTRSCDKNDDAKSMEMEKKSERVKGVNDVKADENMVKPTFSQTTPRNGTNRMPQQRKKAKRGRHVQGGEIKRGRQSQDESTSTSSDQNQVICLQSKKAISVKEIRVTLMPDCFGNTNIVININK